MQQDELNEFMNMISPSLRRDVIKSSFDKFMKTNNIFEGSEDEQQLMQMEYRIESRLHLPDDPVIV